MITIHPDEFETFSPTCNGDDLVALQQQVYREVRASRRPARQLMTWLIDRRNLTNAWERVRQSDGAQTPGVDGLTCLALKDRISSWLTELADDLFHRRYSPEEPRWILIPKPNKPGLFRQLGILTIRDRVVQAALKQVLEPILEPHFLSNSFGFRPGRSVTAALGAVIDGLSPAPGQPVPYPYLVQMDIANCFDTIDHARLMKELRTYVDDPDILQLVEGITRLRRQTSGWWWKKRSVGLVQGGALSPLLCNLALHELDLAIHRLGKEANYPVRFFRYADDLLLVARDRSWARKGISWIRTTLKRMHQSFRARPRISWIQKGVDWLGVTIQSRSESWGGRVRVGYRVPDAKVESMFQRIIEMTTPPSDKIDPSTFNLARWIVSLNDQLRDWRQVYLFADNAINVFRAIDDLTRERLATLIRAITGEKAYALFRQYRARLPRGFWTWEVPGARLSILSSLAPHAPAFLVRQPVWMRPQVKSKPLTVRTSARSNLLALPPNPSSNQPLPEAE